MKRQTCLMMSILCLMMLTATAALAERHSGPYVGGYAGANFLLTADSTDNNGSFNFSYNPALLYSAVIGWEFGPNNPFGGGEGRIELEYAHRSNPVDKVDFKQGSFTGSGDMVADSILLNCIYVYRTPAIWSPYILAGAGVARVKSDDIRLNGGKLISDDSDTPFAFQAGAGVEVDLGASFSLDIAYRFFGTLQPTLKEPDGTTFRTDYLNHSVLLGVRYGF